MQGRSFSTDGYRYGFNGKEKDNEVSGSGNQYDYGFRIYNPRLGKFLSVDPLYRSYPMIAPYQFSENSPIRFVDLDGLETADPSFFRKAINAICGHFHMNRLNRFIADNDVDPDDVVCLPNETYVIVQTFVNASTGLSSNKYTIIRAARQGVHFPVGQENDDYYLSEEEFTKTQVLGEKVMDAPLPISGGGKSMGMVMKGGKDATYAFRQFVGTVEKGGKMLTDWKKFIKFGVLDALGTSGDLIKKGFHVHFKELKGLELGLTAKEGKLAFNFIRDNSDLAGKAITVFSNAMKNKQFRGQLLSRLKGAEQTLTDAVNFLLEGNAARETAMKTLKEVIEVVKNTK